ncbi:type III pantothenate kinase [Hydrogenimonas sp.]
MMLCDIGNSRMHFFDGERLEHLSYGEGFLRYGKGRVCYICVNEEVRERIGREAPRWVDAAAPQMLRSDYRGMGIDRVAACLAVEEGVVIDAGSAVTVDVMERGRHLGGWIWPGIASLKRAYAGISPKLAVDPVPDGAFDRLPLETGSAVSFAVFAPVKTLVERFAPGKPVIVTGGDAPLFAPLFPEARIDELLVFRGMEKMLKEERC